MTTSFSVCVGGLCDKLSAARLRGSRSCHTPGHLVMLSRYLLPETGCLLAALGTVTLAGCNGHDRPATPAPVLRLADNSALITPLARELGIALPDVRVEIIPGNIEEIVEGRADVGLALADWTHLTHGTGAADARRDDGVRGIAVLDAAPLHLLVARDSGITHIGQVRGRRVRVGVPRNPVAPGDLPFAGSGVLAETVMAAFGVGPDEVQAESLSPAEALQRLTHGSLDAFFTTPFSPLSGVGDAMAAGARLLPIEGAIVTKLRQEYPFLRLTTIIPGTYPNQTHAVHTVGIDSLVVCRADLDGDLVYRLTKHLFVALRRLAVANPYLRRIDVSRVPATPIPLHPGAARYYRETELFR